MRKLGELVATLFLAFCTYVSIDVGLELGLDYFAGRLLLGIGTLFIILLTLSCVDLFKKANTKPQPLPHNSIVTEQNLESVYHLFDSNKPEFFIASNADELYNTTNSPRLEYIDRYDPYNPSRPEYLHRYDPNDPAKPEYYYDPGGGGYYDPGGDGYEVSHLEHLGNDSSNMYT